MNASQHCNYTKGVVDQIFSKQEKPVKIDKVGIWRAENGEEYIFPSLSLIKTGDLVGMLVSGGTIHFYQEDGTGTYGDVPRIKEFVSSCYDFEAQEAI